MKKIPIFLTLIAISLIFFSCSKEPEVAIEDPLEFYNDWTMLFKIRTDVNSTNIIAFSSNYYYVLIDKDKNVMYTLFTNEVSIWSIYYPGLGYGGKGIGLIHIFKDEPSTRHLALIEETLKQNNVTNVIFSFWVEINWMEIYGTNSGKIIIAGFDEDITNVGSGVYGLGMYEGVFDGNGKITNVHKIIPIANYTNIPEFPGDFIWYDINVGNISIKSGDASNNSLETNISF
jgi:hypothetical protein